MPRLYVGGAWNAANLYELGQAKVGWIVSMAAEFGSKPFCNTIHYKHFPLEDDEREFALAVLVESAAFIDRALRDESKMDSTVLVHCAMGRSRSVAAVLAFLMHDQRVSFDQALAFLRRAHPVARPNPGYVLQLQALDTLLRQLPLSILCLAAEHL